MTGAIAPETMVVTTREVATARIGAAGATTEPPGTLRVHAGTPVRLVRPTVGVCSWGPTTATRTTTRSTAATTTTTMTRAATSTAGRPATTTETTSTTTGTARAASRSTSGPPRWTP